jgi:hypothetical protein
VPIVLEHGVDRLQDAVLLDVDLVVPVDQDVGDLRVGQQLFQRPQAEQLVEDVDDEILALDQRERRLLGFLLQERADDRAEFRLGVPAADFRQPLEVEAVEQLFVQPALDLLVLGVPEVTARRLVSLDGVHTACHSTITSVQFSSTGRLGFRPGGVGARWRPGLQPRQLP